MQKKKVYITTAYIFLALLTFSFLYNNTFQTTGFVVYSAQPDPTTGKDSYLKQTSYTNYGTAVTLKVGTATNGATEYRPILFFDTSSITSTDTIINANLSIYITTTSTVTGNFTLNVYRLTSNWTETDSNWYNKNDSTNWTNAGSDYDTEVIASALITNETGWYNFTITELAKDWIDGTSDNYGLLLYAPDATIGDSKEIISSDYTINTTLRPTIKIDHTENAAPIINEISSDSSISSPITAGSNVTFQTNWTDLESEDTRTFICSSTSVNTSGCADTTFCSTTLASTNPSTCTYTTSGSDNTTTTFYVAVCDSTNCSTVSNANYFYVNHNPIIALTQPNGGETLNQSLGNYSITFNVSDANSGQLYANIYYGSTQNSTTNTIASNLNLTLYCTDADEDTSTTNNCVYSWNTSGIYETAFLTIILNDTFTTVTESSNSSFDIRGINDDNPPQIATTSIETTIHSGKSTQINTTITDDNTLTAWVSFNYTSENATMSNTSITEFNTTFYAPAVGIYQYKIWARDLLGNTNSSEWQTFTTSAPNATVLTSTAPSIALPYHTILITSQIKANNSLRNVYAYLNTPEGFTFLTDYPQDSSIGNLTDNETTTATWFLSVPMTENTYTLNATFRDGYSNNWNSSNMEIEVTSAIGGGYTLEIAGSTEVETTQDYYVEGKFKQDATYTSPDTATISIYDANGNLAIGPSSMTEESTGQYNFTYTVGPSVTEGIWETIINATYSGTSYYVNEFWNVVGGPFDVRNITILNSSIDGIIINVTTENTGGANKDLTLVWNLTREDTGAILHSEAETFMVSASSTKDWTIYPETTYVGQVRITMIGYYSDTEKAGAYKVFSTTTGSDSTTETPTSSGGSGGSTSTIVETQETYSLEIINFDKTFIATKNMEETYQIKIKNTGNRDITNLKLDLENIEEKYYKISPFAIATLKSNETANFQITLTITDFIGEKEGELKLTSNEINRTEDILIQVLIIEKYFENKIKEFTQQIILVNNTLIEEKKKTLLDDLALCQNILETLKLEVEKEEFINAKDRIIEIENCVNEVKDRSSKLKKVPFIEIKLTDYIVWIITWTLIIILLIAITTVIYFLTKKLSILKYTRRKQSSPQETENSSKTNLIDERLKDIKKRLG